MNDQLDPAAPPPENEEEASAELVAATEANPETSEGWGAILNPTTRADAWDMCVKVARSDFCPSAYKGHPFEIALAAAMGSRVGFDLMTSLQSICVIKGNPTLYGDRMLGLVQSQPDYVDLVGTFDQDREGGYWHYVCKRKGRSDCPGFYSYEMATKAGYTKKQGPWHDAPLRMVQWRARTFAMRDQFADVLGGFTVAEDLMHLNYVKKTPQAADAVDLTDMTGAADENQ